MKTNSVTTTVLLCTTVACALAALPATRFPPQWLAAFLLPGIFFQRLSATPAMARLGFAFRLWTSLALQGALAFLLVRGAAVGPEAALTLQLMAPLAFLVLRREENDVLLATFLAFCLLLIGTMLQHPAPLVAIVLFVVSATLSLHHQTLRDTDGTQPAGETQPHRTLRPGRTILAGATLAIAVLLTAFLALAGLREMPGQAGPRSQLAQMPGPPAPRLRNDFDLSPGGGIPLDFSAEEILKAYSLGGAPLAPDLYLRCAFFDIPWLDRWEASALPASGAVTLDATDWKVKEAWAGEPVQNLYIKPRADNDGWIFVPTGVLRILDVAKLRANARHGWFRDVDGSALRGYRLTWQDLGRAAADRPVDPIFVPGMVQLPPELQGIELQVLAQEFTRNVRPRSPHNIALALAEGLRRRCTYKLEEPTGSSEHALHNFLFGSRSGYCMHFASALAVLLRLEGVPCRIAVGLYGGKEVLGERRARIYAGTDAHAWVEVPYQDLGFVTYDATDGATVAGERWPEAAMEPDPTTEREALELPHEDPLHGALARLFEFLPWVLALVLGLLLWPLVPAAGRRPAERPLALPEARTARRRLEEIQKALAQRGRPRPHGSTLEQFAAGLQDLPAETRDPLIAAFVAYQEVRFGGRPLDEERAKRLSNGLLAAEQVGSRSSSG